MVKVKDVLKYLDGAAPVSIKMDFDNVGHLAGDSQAEVRGVLLALDITEEVISEAAEKGAELIVSHHPMFFSLKSVTEGDYTGRAVLKLLSSGISAICMHTNLDAAQGGVNHVLAERAGIKDPALLKTDGLDREGEPYGIGLYGELERERDFYDYMAFLKDSLNAPGFRYYNSGRRVSKVAVVGGSGGSDMGHAIKQGCDTLVTADVKYDIFLRAKAEGINLIDGGHFSTENVIIPVLAEKIKREFPSLDVYVSEKHGDTVSFFV